MDSLECIDNTDAPKTQCWKFNTLYKIDQNGNTRQWQIGFDAPSMKLITVHGLSSSLRVDKRIVVPKSKRTLQEQALLEMRNRYTKKIRDGYSTTMNAPSRKFKIQLANKYRSGKSTNIKGFPVAVQPKLNGIRAYAVLDDNVSLKSRKHIEFPFLDPIKEDVSRIFKQLPEGTVLDGELYIHGESFQTLSSIIRMRNSKHPLNGNIIYNIFDISTPTDMSSEERFKIINDAISNIDTDHVMIVKQEIVGSHEELDSYHDDCVSKGYEGIMIRHIKSAVDPKHHHLSYYKGGRNNALIKYKKFQEEEGTILDILEGTGREKGKAILQVKDPRGNVFKVRPRGNFDDRQNIYTNKDQHIGKEVTYSFQCLSDKGVPVFAVAKAIRDYEF